MTIVTADDAGLSATSYVGVNLGEPGTALLATEVAGACDGLVLPPGMV